jgi:transposase
MEEAVRLREANRKQLLMRAEDLDSLLGPEHVARAIWRVLERMDLTRLYQAIKAREGSAGRDATDPKLLLALWLYGLSEGINSARELGTAEPGACRVSLDLRWSECELPHAQRLPQRGGSGAGRTYGPGAGGADA